MAMGSFRVGGRVLSWAVIVIGVALLAVAVVVPRLGGATPYVILTGSMRPAMPPGTLVVVKPVPAAALEVGSVITYQLHSGVPDVVTHRVVAVKVDGRGHRSFVTRGDANPSPDPAAVYPVQVKGERWYDVPYVGYATSLLTGPQRRVATVAAATGLFLYALLMFAGAAAGRGTRRRSAVAR